jgi:hypothetical protein
MSQSRFVNKIFGGIILNDDLLTSVNGQILDNNTPLGGLSSLTLTGANSSIGQNTTGNITIYGSTVQLDASEACDVMMTSDGNIAMTGHSLTIGVPQQSSFGMSTSGNIALNGLTFDFYTNNSGFIFDTAGNFFCGGTGECNLFSLTMSSHGNTLGDLSVYNSGGSFSYLVTTDLITSSSTTTNLITTSLTTANLTTTNMTTSNLFSTNITSTNSKITNSDVSNITIGNVLFKNFLQTIQVSNNSIDTGSHQCGFFQNSNQTIATQSALGYTMLNSNILSNRNNILMTVSNYNGNGIPVVMVTNQSAGACSFTISNASTIDSINNYVGISFFMY